MQCLAELLLSYTHCKGAFLSFSKKHHGDGSSKESKGARGPILNFLLSEIVCYSSLTRPESADSRKRALISQGGMSVILALCVDPMPLKLVTRGIPPELTVIRKYVLDAIIKAVKETSNIPSVEARYGKLASLADLIYRLLVLKSTFGSNKERDDTPLQIAKLMLEKNLVSSLTTTLSDIDPNYPGARSLVSNILRPLEQL
jgi:E3 ubiquitin-protein ligase HUWE1